jgi:hypothetical protein
VIKISINLKLIFIFALNNENKGIIFLKINFIFKILFKKFVNETNIKQIFFECPQNFL